MDTNRHVMLTCGGRWVGMVCQIRNTLPLVPELAGGKVLVADHLPHTPAGVFADAAFRVPLIQDPDYVPRLLELCQTQAVRVLLPLIDVDFLRLAPHLDAFEAVGTTVVSPARHLVELAFDKRAFDAFAQAQHIPVPKIYPEGKLEGAPFPLFYKPSRGFGSRGTGRAQDGLEARRALAADPGLIFQACLGGEEVCVDAFVSKDGRVLHAVQRVRDKVIGGESVESHTVRREPIRRAAQHALAALAATGFHGPANLQFFDSEEPVLFDANLRLGLGGSMLSNQATRGAFYAAVLQEAAGGTAAMPAEDYEVGLVMRKFLGDYFHAENGETRQIVPGPPTGT